jgi:hypothetical protein
MGQTLPGLISYRYEDRAILARRRGANLIFARANPERQRLRSRVEALDIAAYAGLPFALI